MIIYLIFVGASCLMVSFISAFIDDEYKRVFDVSHAFPNASQFRIFMVGSFGASLCLYILGFKLDQMENPLMLASLTWNERDSAYCYKISALSSSLALVYAGELVRLYYKAAIQVIRFYLRK